MYSIKKIDVKEYNTAKIVCVATEFDKFKDVLLNEKIIRHKMKRTQRKKHKLGTYEIDKISLSCLDGKRCVLDDGIQTLAYFHKDSAGADSGLVKLVVMTNVFFNNQQHKIKIKRFLFFKEITSSFFSNN